MECKVSKFADKKIDGKVCHDEGIRILQLNVHELSMLHMSKYRNI